MSGVYTATMPLSVRPANSRPLSTGRADNVPYVQEYPTRPIPFDFLLS